jgi:hypothetical protein
VPVVLARQFGRAFVRHYLRHAGHLAA